MKEKKVLVPILIIIPLLIFGVELMRAPFRARIFSTGPSLETQGLRVAEKKGCLLCHGAWGQGGVPNPGAKTVPAFQDFTFMMSIADEFELREWILDGAPASLRKKPEYEQQKSERAVTMPAYRHRLTARELDLLVAFYHGISGTVFPKSGQAELGFKTAQAKGCFSCHGLGGRFDLPNPGSFVGRIPSWHGEDFADLARNEEEIRAWILDGTTPRLARHPIASWFAKRQVVKMPAYRGKISDEELEAILAYILWLRDAGAAGHIPDFGSLENLTE